MRKVLYVPVYDLDNPALYTFVQRELEEKIAQSPLEKPIHKVYHQRISGAEVLSPLLGDQYPILTMLSSNGGKLVPTINDACELLHGDYFPTFEELNSIRNPKKHTSAQVAQGILMLLAQECDPEPDLKEILFVMEEHDAVHPIDILDKYMTHKVTSTLKEGERAIVFAHDDQQLDIDLRTIGGIRTLRYDTDPENLDKFLK